jgi:type I restriction enzyme S subunit
MRKVSKYPSYKESDVEWLGSIPEHWKIVNAKRIFREVSIKNHPDEPLLAATQIKGVIPKSLYENTTVTASKNFETLKLVRKGDFVISLRSFQGGIEYAHYQGIISPAYTILEPQDEVIHYYYRYLLKSKRYISGLTLLVTGIREGQNIDTAKFKDSFLPLPPKEEQTAIARFLDYKLAKINRFIQKKKQLIKLLNEQKAAIINQAVTKGLDAKVKMKPSGIEWLGDIPEHWEVTRAKYLGKAIIGLTYSPSEETDSENGILVLRSSNVQNEKITYDDCVYVSTEIPENKITRLGDILICSRNGSIKLIGKNALIDEKAEGLTFGAFMTIFRSPNYDFLHYFFNSASFKAQSGLFSTSTINQLTTGILNNIIVAIPKSLNEQLEIVEFIKSETEIINTTISKIEKELALTEEYKTALIAEAVTGKIDVRGYEVPEVMEEERYEELEEEIGMVAENEGEFENE